MAYVDPIPKPIQMVKPNAKPNPRNMRVRGGKSNASNRASAAARSDRQVTQYVSVPVASTTIVARKAEPFFASRRNGDVCITHREYFADIGSTDAFTNAQFTINPGNSTVFPWLSGLARNYESYVFRRLSFQYRTGQTTASSGRIGMFVDFDCADPAPLSKAQAYSNRNCVDGPVWHDLRYQANREDLNKRKSYYVSHSVAPALIGTIAENLADVGILNVFTSMDSVPNASSGELFVEYEVELLTPSQPDDILAAHVLLDSTQGVSSTTPAGTTLAGFQSATTKGSDPLLTWVGPTQLAFVEDFIGTMIFEYTGTGITAFPTYAGATTSVTVTPEENSYLAAAATTAIQIIQVIALAGELISFIGLTATSLSDVALRCYSNSRGL